MITIYHNTRCSKSREGVCFLENAKLDFEVINYLEKAPTKRTLKSLLKKLKYTPIELVRKKEAIWIEHYANKKLSDEEVIEALIKYPILIERPIIVKGNKAIIGRPTERIQEIL